MKNLKYKHLFFILLAIVPVVAFSAGLIPCEGSLKIGDKLGDCDFAKFIELIKNVINFMIFKLALPLAAISFAIAGIMLMTAGGKEDQIKKAKEIFWYVLVGIFVTLSSWLVVNTIAKVLLNPEFSGLG